MGTGSERISTRDLLAQLEDESHLQALLAAIAEEARWRQNLLADIEQTKRDSLALLLDDTDRLDESS